MFNFLKKLNSKVNKLDNFVNEYKENAGEVSMPGYAFMNWGIKLLENGDDKETAIKMLQQSTDMPYANSDSYVNLGIALAREGRYDEALPYFRKAIRLNPENPKAYQMMGSLYSEINENKKAEIAFEKALEYGPKMPQTYLNRAIFYAKINKIKEADADFKTACRLNPSNQKAWFLWGVLSAQAKQYKDAELKFERAVALDPFYAEAYYHLASISFLDKNFKNAVKYAKKSITIDSERTDCYVVLAEAWLNLKNKEKCLQTYESVDNKCKLTARFYYSWGISLQFFKKWKESIEKLNKSLELDSKNYLTDRKSVV